MAGMEKRLTPCRGCGQMIGFVVTEKGKTMPVDPDGVRFTPGGGPDTYVMSDGRIARGARRANGAAFGFVPHWVTCPAANEFRKGRHKGK